MTTSHRERVVTSVDPELDRLVNDEGMCQLKASQRLYAPGIEFPIRPTAPTDRQVAEFVEEHLDVPAGRWHFADVLRWLTGGRRP